jgi:type I restriction enzyme S subunit
MSGRAPAGTDTAAGDWLSDLEGRWPITKIRFVARLESGHTPSRRNEEYWVPEECVIPWFTLADVWQIREAGRVYLDETTEKVSEAGLANSSARLLPANTVIFSRTASVGFSGILAVPMATSQDFVGWVCGPRVRPEFLLYVLRAMRPEFARLMMGSTHQTIYMPDIHDFRTPIPPLDEQDGIIGFLDKETARIDALIAAKERFLKLLDEKRAALITHAVTKGLDPSAPMKPTALSWLGDVPAHWSVVKIRFEARLETGHTPSRKVAEYWIPEECVIPWFTLADVWQIREEGRIYVDETAEKVTEVGLANSAARLLPSGTVILSRTASVGFSGILAMPMATSQDFVGWICGPRLRPEFLLYAVRAMKREFARLMMGSTHQTIYMPDIHDLSTPLPPLDEQLRIVAFLDREIAALDTLASLTRHTVKILHEHRAALVTAAVLGRIDIASSAATEPVAEAIA